MKNTNLKNWKLGISLMMMLAISLMAACSTTPTAAPAANMEEAPQSAVEAQEMDTPIVDQEDNPTNETTVLSEELPLSTDSELSMMEIEGLLFMREEEKLARDVYLTLYEIWQQNTFNNISRSEQAHTDEIKVLLDQYGLEDPMSNDEIGVFENADLQALYDELIELGSQSLGDALRVGAAIEEIDILDLQDSIEQSTHLDIQLVYENLIKGSRNHLRSFVSVLEKKTGEIYEPQYLSPEAYADIINAEKEAGSGEHGEGDTH
jgi:hypothetical protein